MSEMADKHMDESLDVMAEDVSGSARQLLPGAQLAAQRQALGWSVEQISDQLKLAHRQVIAIEQDDYDALPGLAVTRGFIRAYAKLLKLDAAPLLASMIQDVVAGTASAPLRRALPTTFSETRLPLMGNRRDILTRWNVGVVLLVLLLLIALLAQQMNWIPALPDSFAVKSKKEDALINTPAVTSAASTEETSVTSSAPDVAPLQLATEVAVTEKSAAVPAAPIAAINEGGVVPLVKDQLLVKIHEDSWVDVKQKNGSSVLSRLLKAGSSETFEVGEGLSLTVGNAGGVEVLLRGEPVDIKSGAKNNIARVKLK